MNFVWRFAYGAVGQAARAVAALTPAGEGKLRRSLRARRGIQDRIRRWAREHRDRARPLLWMHAPSVGEGLQASPVFDRVRLRRPDLQTAWTFYSPSAERFAAARGADLAEYLPFDTRGDARAMLDALRPKALVFSKLDVWPELVAEAKARGVRLGLLSATLSPDSARLGRIGRALLHASYDALDAVGAISAEDAERLVALGARRHLTTVMGDTRYDQVWARAAAVDRAGPLLAPLASPRPTLVAGSTWPADEAVLAAAWPAVRRAAPEARLIIAPHEPVERHLRPIEEWAAQAGLTCARLSHPRAPQADVVLVDRVGVLGDLYALGSAAFVGGGFHAAGLHSVLEPAAFAIPVACGPLDASQRDAALLQGAGGLERVADTAAFGTVVGEWLRDRRRRTAAGHAAREVVVRGLGAADRATEMVLKLLS